MALARITGTALEPRAHHRHVAGVVAHPVVLLEADFVRLVDHDQAELRIGQEQRRARADHDLRLAGDDRPPGVAPLGRLERGMPHHRRRAEALLEAPQEGFGQRDFGEQDKRLFPLTQRFGDGLEIGLGLARPGDPVEQERGEAPLRDRARPVLRLGLRRSAPGLGKEIGRGGRVGRSAVDGDRLEHALVDQPAQHALADPRDAGELADRRLLALEALIAAALRRHPLGHPPLRRIVDQSPGRRSAPLASTIRATEASERR